MSRRYLRASAWVLLAAMMMGCQNPSAKLEIVSAGDVQSVVLFTTPSAVNLDQSPGPDGLRVKVYAFSRGQPKPVAIGNGSVEILLFEGGEEGGALNAEREPLQIWDFPWEDLAKRMSFSSIGVGYPLVLRWTGSGPRDRYQVAARVRDENGVVATSRPVTLQGSVPSR